MYVIVCTRQDIAHVGVVSRYMSHPRIENWNAIKWIIRYLRGTFNKSLNFGGFDIDSQGYVDSDLAGDLNTKRSTTRYVFTVSGRISQLQKANALSTIEAKYVVAIEAIKEMIWPQRFFQRVRKLTDKKLYVYK